MRWRDAGAIRRRQRLGARGASRTTAIASPRPVGGRRHSAVARCEAPCGSDPIGRQYTAWAVTVGCGGGPNAGRADPPVGYIRCSHRHRAPAVSEVVESRMSRLRRRWRKGADRCRPALCRFRRRWHLRRRGHGGRRPALAPSPTFPFCSPCMPNATASRPSTRTICTKPPTTRGPCWPNACSPPSGRREPSASTRTMNDGCCTRWRRRFRTTPRHSPPLRIACSTCCG